MSEPVGESKTKKRNPSYAVFETTDEDGVYRRIGGVFAASSRKEAIKMATAAGGTFLVVPEKEIKPITRKTRTEQIDEFD